MRIQMRQHEPTTFICHVGRLQTETQLRFPRARPYLRDCVAFPCELYRARHLESMRMPRYFDILEAGLFEQLSQTGRVTQRSLPLPPRITACRKGRLSATLQQADHHR
jgi:hypothetical protein